MIKLTLKAVATGIFALCMSNTALADGLKSLSQFYADTKSLQANFHQVVTDNQGRKMQSVDGKVLIQRPNQFRWDYQKPYAQEIVSDGKFVYLYDVELEQVTVNPVTSSLGASPAALLSGAEDLTNNFILAALDKGDNLEWVDVIPKKNDTGFNRIEIAFNNSGVLQAMVLLDSFGQKTQITFSQQSKNPTIPAATFDFKAPPGVDVLGQ